MGQGQGSHIKLWDLGLYPGTRTLSAAGGLAGWGCRMAHWGGPSPENDAGWHREQRPVPTELRARDIGGLWGVANSKCELER